MLKITGAFLDEISADIASLNYDEEQWEQEFHYMKAVGIEHVIMIRGGHSKTLAMPSRKIACAMGCYPAYDNLSEMFLRLAEKFGMRFFFGTYYSCHDWLDMAYDPIYESDLICSQCEDFYNHCGKYSTSFGGWYLSQEISDQRSYRVVECYKNVGKFCKGLAPSPVLISPYIRGPKYGAGVPRRKDPISMEEHRENWDWIFSEVEGIIDVAAFQDGHVDFEDVEGYLRVSREVGEKHGIDVWTNTESFDRDIPGMLPPIRWEKMRMKLESAERAGIQTAITFDFAHFFSPRSPYATAANLLRRYCKHQNIPYPENF